MEMIKKATKYGLISVLIFGVPSLVFADNVIQTSIQTDKSSSIGVGYSSLHHYKFTHCTGKPIKGYDWSGNRCYINGEMRSSGEGGLSASAELTAISDDGKSWCSFRLVILDLSKGKKNLSQPVNSNFQESLTQSETHCRGSGFSGVYLNKIDATHYQLFVKEK